MEQYLETAVTAAREAGKIHLEYLHKEKNIDFKGRINLVTDVDRKSEETIIKIIRERHPSHQIIAEETLPDSERQEYTWYVDPLDGTTNYSHAFPIFAVSIALEINREICVGVVYDATRDELFSAVKGKGAFLNNQPISRSNTSNVGKSLILTGFPYEITQRSIDLFNDFVVKAQAVRRAGAAAVDLCYLAAGRADGFWELDLKPWDMAAGKIILTEAGCKITKFDGSKHSLFDNNTLASNGLIHEEMMEIIKKSGSAAF